MIGVLALIFSVIPAWEASQQEVDDNCNCCTEAYKQFDFWIGSWDVYDPDGKKVGENEITSIQGHCALRENWTGASGGSGTSLNYYNNKTKKWHQVWVDQTGGVLNLSGSFAENKMTLMSEELYSEKQEKHYQDRIVWTNNGDGTVRQVWERTVDKGESWILVFNGLYKKRK